MKDGYFVVIRHKDGGAYVVPEEDDSNGEDFAIWDTEEEAEEWCRENALIQSGQVNYAVYPLP